MMGGNNLISGGILCPYYIRADNHDKGQGTITCEGLVPKTETVVKFRTNRDMASWLLTCCKTYRYGECPIARANSCKYPEE